MVLLKVQLLLYTASWASLWVSTFSCIPCFVTAAYTSPWGRTIIPEPFPRRWTRRQMVVTGQLSPITKDALMSTFVCMPLGTSILFLFGCVSEEVLLGQGIGTF